MHIKRKQADRPVKSAQPDIALIAGLLFKRNRKLCILCQDLVSGLRPDGFFRAFRQYFEMSPSELAGRSKAGSRKITPTGK